MSSVVLQLTRNRNTLYSITLIDFSNRKRYEYYINRSHTVTADANRGNCKIGVIASVGGLSSGMSCNDGYGKYGYNFIIQKRDKKKDRIPVGLPKKIILQLCDIENLSFCLSSLNILSLPLLTMTSVSTFIIH